MPDVTPVRTQVSPELLVMVARPGTDRLQLPVEPVGSLKVKVVPIHTLLPPVIAVGSGLTVTAA